jgi:hypothetical protein
MSPSAELTKHFRKRLKHEGIKARCSTYEACGIHWIRISPPEARALFSESEERTIRLIAIANKLTLTYGAPIILEQMTNSVGAQFVIPPDHSCWSA